MVQASSAVADVHPHRKMVKLRAPLPLLFIRLGPMATRRSVIAPLLFLNLRTGHISFFYV